VVIQSVDRAVRILEALCETRRQGVTELSARLGIAKGTTHGLLRTLQAHGLVEQDVDTGKYQLGVTSLALSNNYLGINDLRSQALAWSELLATRTSEGVHVGTRHGDTVLVIHHVFRPDSTLQILDVGAVLPLHATALGKAILAFTSPPVLDELISKSGLARLTSHTLSSRVALQRDLDTVRARRYALEREEAVLGEGAIAAAIFDRRGSVAGAIGIVGPRDRLFKGDRQAGLVDAVMEAARGISRNLGASR
jgi:DNA-binding IclR family transcriptional regulator